MDFIFLHLLFKFWAVVWTDSKLSKRLAFGSNFSRGQLVTKRLNQRYMRLCWFSKTLNNKKFLTTVGAALGKNAASFQFDFLKRIRFQGKH